MTAARADAALAGGFVRVAGAPPPGMVGADLGLTLSKFAVVANGGFRLSARLSTAPTPAELENVPSAGVTGARSPALAGRPGLAVVPEIDAGARGAAALLRDPVAGFVLALLGTGTAFVAVRDGQARHLGGTAVGGGSFAGLARRVAPGLTYPEWLAAAARGDRRNADLMVADAYPDGIGRVAPNLTAAHLAAPGDPTLDDVLAALMNLHGESIGQIAASRARIAGIGRVVLAGGFAHDNPALVTSIAAMTAMFGVAAEAVPAPAYAGAIGAALVAAEAAAGRSTT